MTVQRKNSDLESKCILQINFYPSNDWLRKLTQKIISTFVTGCQIGIWIVEITPFYYYKELCIGLWIVTYYIQSFFSKTRLASPIYLIEHEPSYEVRAIKSTVSKIDQTLERKQFNAL